ncbi:MAG: amidohydrolase [Zhaonellaceae bacterium]|jgi:5-methylthioadenosine/S-adenosylhomocysteine deaminase|nr:amidohydrolase [Clostridia bacterium]
MAVLIKNVSYLIRDAERVEEGKDVLLKENKIWKVGKFTPDWVKGLSSYEVIDASGKMVIPGFINAHTHLYQSLLKGCQDDLPLVDWCNQVTFPLCQLIAQEERKKDDTLGYYWGLLSSLEMLKNGVTTCLNLDMSLNSVFQAWVDSGIRGIGAITTADMWIPDVLKEEPIQLREKVLSFIEKWHLYGGEDSRIYVMFGPSAPFVCSEDLLLWTREEASKRKMHIHTHIAETLYEVELLEKENGLRPLKYLHSLGFLGPDLSAAHCIHLDDEELELIKRYQVIPVHNPKSNMKLASGIAPVTKMLSMGIKVGLGTDGCASNDNLDMFEEMRFASLLQKVATANSAAFSARDAFRMATEGGALACGIDAGTIDEGKLADLVIIDLEQPHLYPLHDPINTLVYCGKSSDVETVIINGQVVVRNKEVISLPEREVLEEARRVIATKITY